MLTILSNNFFVFILPFFIGFVLRFVLRKTHKPFILTICLIAFAVLMWSIANIVPNHGSEANGLRAVMAICAATGALIAELICRVQR